MIPGLPPKPVFRGLDSRRACAGASWYPRGLSQWSPSHHFWTTCARKVGHWSPGAKLGCAFTNAGAPKADVLAAKVIGRGWDEITETLH